jgi:hypothetical protein
MSYQDVLHRYIEYALPSMGFSIILLIGWCVVRKRNATAKNAYFMLFCGPVLFLEIFLLSALDRGTLLIRLSFLTMAIFLPASLYFLFIAARRGLQPPDRHPAGNSLLENGIEHDLTFIR